MSNMIDFNQIRINAVLGVCQRQRELVAENRRLREQANKADDLAGYIGLGIATAFIVACFLI